MYSVIFFHIILNSPFNFWQLIVQTNFISCPLDFSLAPTLVRGTIVNPVLYMYEQSILNSSVTNLTCPIKTHVTCSSSNIISSSAVGIILSMRGETMKSLSSRMYGQNTMNASPKNHHNFALPVAIHSTSLQFPFISIEKPISLH